MCCPGYDINRYLSTFKLFFPPALSGELSKIMKTSEKYKRFSGELQIQVSHIFFVRSHSVVMQISKLIFYVKFFLTTNALFIKDVVYRRKVRDLHYHRVGPYKKNVTDLNLELTREPFIFF